MTHRIIIRNNSTDQSYSPRWSTIENIVAEEREDRPDAVLSLRMILNLAAAHWYGRNCTFFRDKGLVDQGIFGQIVEPCSTGGLNCVTPRIQFKVYADSRSVKDTIELHEALGMMPR